MANANLAASNTFGVACINANGSMNWNTANDWIAAMNADGGNGYLGINNWGLPITTQPDATCNTQSGGQGVGTGCTGSEMGHLFNVAWAVHSGDVSAVPIPGAVWLFGSGLIGLLGLARRKR